MKQLLTDLGIALNFDFSYSYDGQTITLKDTVLTIDGRPVNLNSAEVKTDFPILSKKTVVKALFNNLLGSVEKVKQNYFEKFEDNFELLLSQTRYLIDIEQILVQLQTLNVAYSFHSDLLDKTKQNVSQAIRHIITYNDDKLSYPQQYVLDYDNNYTNSPWLDLNEMIDSVKNDTSKLDKFKKDLDTFDYTPYISKEAWIETTKEIYSEIESTYNNYKLFRELKETLGDKIVELTSRKMTIRYPNYHREIWNWIEPVIADLKTKGIMQKVSVPKSQKLKDKYERKQELTQEELVSLFKTCALGETLEVLGKLDYDHQVSLLDLQTKTVNDRLFYKYRSDNAIELILKNVITKKDTVAFKKILFKCSSMSLESLITFADSLTVPEFVEHVSKVTSSRNYYSYNDAPIIEVPDKIYKEKLLKMTKETRYTTHQSITHAFVTRMSKTNKEKFLQSYESNFIVADETFKTCTGVSYDVVKTFVKKNPDLWEVFIDVVTAHKDKKTLSMLIKEEGRSEDELLKKAFPILSLKEKLETLKSLEHSLDAESIPVAKEELHEFLKACVKSEKLTSYVKVIEKSKNIQALALVLDKVTGYQIPSSEYIVKHLPVKYIVKTLKSGAFAEDKTSYYGYSSRRTVLTEQSIYDRLTRKDIEEVHGKDLSDLPNGKYIAKHLTSKELETYKNDREFIRYNIDILPVKFLESFKDSGKYKELVGDRRDTYNNRIGTALTKRLNVIA